MFRLSVVFLAMACTGVADDLGSLLEAAKSGNVDAQMHVATYYYSNNQFRKAADWFERAAKQGNARAAYELGMEYQLGMLPPTRGLLKVPYSDPEYNWRMARLWILKSASDNYAPACRWMGWYLVEGYRAGRSDAEVATTTTVHPPPSSEPSGGFFGGLADGLAGGRNRDTTVRSTTSTNLLPGPDYASAMTWYRRAADQNDVPSMAAIAKFYEQGLGVDRNPDLAIKWYSKAAGLGDSTSRIRLEILLEQRDPLGKG